MLLAVWQTQSCFPHNRTQSRKTPINKNYLEKSMKIYIVAYKYWFNEWANTGNLWYLSLRRVKNPYLSTIKDASKVERKRLKSAIKCSVFQIAFKMLIKIWQEILLWAKSIWTLGMFSDILKAAGRGKSLTRKKKEILQGPEYHQACWLQKVQKIVAATISKWLTLHTAQTNHNPPFSWSPRS